MAEVTKAAQEQEEPRVALEAFNGHLVWVPISKAEAWKRGQEKLKAGDPEALMRLEELRSRVMQRLKGE